MPTTLYLWTKVLHIVFVIAWMASVFYLPRILVNLAEAGEAPAVRERLVLMARRLYRFGHVMFGVAFALGMLLWLYFGIGGPWLHVKLALVALLLVHFVIAGRWAKRAGRGGSLPSARALRWFNEIPLLLLVAIVWLVLAKPGM
jgi:putative membrane protein